MTLIMSYYSDIKQMKMGRTQTKEKAMISLKTQLLSWTRSPMLATMSANIKETILIGIRIPKVSLVLVPLLRLARKNTSKPIFAPQWRF